MAEQWIVQREESQFPADDVATLQEWAAAGKIRSEDQVWSPRRAEWAAAAATPEIAALLVRHEGVALASDAGAVVRPSPTSVAPPAVSPRPVMARTPAGLPVRAIGYLIDILPAVLIGMISIIPVAGAVIAGILLGLYWLYRDASKFSLGKIVLGLDVVQSNGEPANAEALKRRNLYLAIPSFVFAIPIVGLVIGPVTAILAAVANLVTMLSEGRTLGDKMADTTVVRRA